MHFYNFLTLEKIKISFINNLYAIIKYLNAQTGSKHNSYG